MKGLSFCVLVLSLFMSHFALEGKRGLPGTDYQRQALESLFNAADGENWKINTNWMDHSVSICDWYGVECSYDQRTVTKLTLEENHLAGGEDSLPTQLGYLTGLQELHLAGNHRLFGHLPSEFGNMMSLTYLNLSDCWNLDGSIPEELGNLIHLQTVDFNNAGMEGFVPWDAIGRLWNLKHLDFKGCGFEGPVTSEIGGLSQLTFLSLINNHFTSELPATLGNLMNLKQLWLYGNYFSGPLPSSLGRLTQLEHLDFGNNYIEGDIPSELAHLSNLVRISGYRNRLTGLFPEFLCSGDFEWCFEDNEWDCPLPECAVFEGWGKHGCGSLSCTDDEDKLWHDTGSDYETDSDYYDDSDSDYDTETDYDTDSWYNWGSSSITTTVHHYYHIHGRDGAFVALIVLVCILGVIVLGFTVMHVAAYWERGHCFPAYEKVEDDTAAEDFKTADTETSNASWWDKLFGAEDLKTADTETSSASWWDKLFGAGAAGFTQLDQKTELMDEETGEWEKETGLEKGLGAVEGGEASPPQTDVPEGFVTFIASPDPSSSGDDKFEGGEREGREGQDEEDPFLGGDKKDSNIYPKLG